MCKCKRILPFLFVASMVYAQNFAINTVAGGGAIVTGQPATSYAVNQPVAVAVDSAGNRYVALQYWCQVWVVNSAGVLTQVIGNGTCGYSGDNGPAASAQLSPVSVAVDTSGNLYIADNSVSVIRKVSGGIITTVAGTYGGGYNGDNIPATTAQLYQPESVAVDNSGNLFIADTANNRIRKVSGGIITTVSGNGTAGFSGDGGSATSAELAYPEGIAVDNSGNLFIADRSNARIREVSGGIITTVAGGGTSFADNVTATSAMLYPYGVAVDGSGNVYIVDGTSRIRKVSGGIITTVAGGGTGALGDGGSATSAALGDPQGVAIDDSGILYIADTQNYRIRKVAGGIITTVVGNGLAYGGDGAVATSAQLTLPRGSAVDSGGNLFIADSGACVVRKVAAGTGIISTVAGINGICGYNGDGINATSAQLFVPSGVALDSSGNIYISDSVNARIRKVSGGIITTVAGGGTGALGDGGSATSAALNDPQGVALDNSGNIYIADTYNYRIRKVAGGIITTVAGNGTFGYNGDNISATSAELYPWAVAVDDAGNLYVADSYNSIIRKVSGGVIVTVAGSVACCYGGDGGSATSAILNQPFGVAVSRSGDLYIADSSNSRIRKVAGGIITTVAGNGTSGYMGDNGSATSAELNIPFGVAVDSSENIYVSDTNNNRIRKLTPTALVNVTSTPSGLTVIVDNASITTPQLFAWTPGSNHTFNANTQPGATGTQYVPVGTFPTSQTYSDTANTATFNVNFTTQYYLTTSAGTGGTISPPSGWYNAGSVVSVSATPSAGYTFAGFTGASTGSTSPQSITMNAPASITGNFTSQQTYTISGQVTLSGVGVSGVTINVTGSTTTSTTTNGSGSYIIALRSGGTYTLAASLAGYSFGARVTFSNLSANQTTNFTGTAGLDFYPVTPCRIADTRNGTGFSGQFGPPAMVAGATRPFSILSSPCAAGIPATVAAYSLNFTVVPPAGGPAANLTTWPVGPTGMPNVSNLNYYGSVVANAAIVPAGTNGAIDVFASYPTDMLFDIDGYFAPPLSSGLEFYPVTPCRIADTRNGTGFSGQFGPPSLAGGATRPFSILSSPCAAGIPATVAAYSLNFTVVPPGGGPESNLTTWPVGPTGMPNVSTLNYYGSVVANAAIVPTGTNGSIDAFVSYPADMLFDINGYFAPASSSGLHFYPVAPCRIADTRTGTGFSGQFGPPSLAGGATRTFNILSISCAAGIPATVAAYSLNFTVVPPAGGPEANLTTWSACQGMPNVSTLNFYDNVVAGAAIVATCTTGAINVCVSYPTDVLFDINGYFAP